MLTYSRDFVFISVNQLGLYPNLWACVVGASICLTENEYMKIIIIFTPFRLVNFTCNFFSSDMV